MLIESIDHKGRGIARINGKIIFVENALIGEDVDITIIKDKKKYCEGVVKKYNKTSENRENVKCPYYDKCGGCQIMHMMYKNQLSFKQDKIGNIIDRYLDKKVVIKPIVYDRQFGYRNKIRLQVNNDIGLYQKNSNDLISIDNCMICSSDINAKINELRKLDLSNIKQITIRTSETENIVLIEALKDVDIELIKPFFDNIVVKIDKEVIKKGHNYISVKINDIVFQISIESFFQVNFNVMKKMYEFIKNCVKDSKSVLDLYCGTGSISLYISNVVSKVYGVEINKQAIIDANINKKLNNIMNVEYKCSDTKDIIINGDYDFIIVDPPRSGLNKSIIDQILKSNASKLIYVSCDPMTLVRDLKELMKRYSIDSITPFDMFSNTYHVESVCLLKLK